MLDKHSSEMLSETLINIQENFAREREEIQESLLDEIDFELEYNGKLFKAFATTMFLDILLFAKIFGHSMISSWVNHEPYVISDMKAMAIVLLALISLLAVVVLVASILMRRKKKIHVHRSMVSCGERRWHYHDISKIVVNRFQIANVYVGDKKVFWTSGDFVNYESFLSWAEKCYIPVERYTDIVSQEIPSDFLNLQMSKKTVMIVIVVMAILLFIGLPIVMMLLLGFI